MVEGQQRAPEARQSGRQETGPTALLEARDAPASLLDGLPIAVQVVAGMIIESQSQPRPV
jgi:hypothetical protein